MVLAESGFVLLLSEEGFLRFADSHRTGCLERRNEDLVRFGLLNFFHYETFYFMDDLILIQIASHRYLLAGERLAEPSSCSCVGLLE